ncbi:MAG: class A beta-lactamase-related serine hydrolase [Alphaproteobacteria bacterium]|nr:class A beta-lactamase-related serine hydrolase [Alphaproteobacteria bacterium]
MTDFAKLQAAITTAEAAGCTLGVTAIAPNGTSFSHNGTRRFVAASTMKIPIMVELFRRIDQGRDSLDHLHVLREEDKATGGGVVKELHAGITFTVRDLCYLMMAISDNSTTNILIDRVGMAETNALMKSLGMQGSVLGRKVRGRPPVEGETENWALPEEYAALIAAILGNKAASPASCAAMVQMLEKQTNDRRIARHLPKGEARPRWGTKTGSLPGVVNDVGFIMAPTGPLVLSIYCEIADPNAGEAVIGDVARAALACT